MLITYIKCLYKETKEVIESFGVIQSVFTTLATLITYYFAFSVIDHIKPYQIEITASIIVILFFLGGFMTWKKERQQLNKTLATKKDNIVVIESEPVWFQIGSAEKFQNIKMLRFYFKFNIQNHKNHSVKINSIDITNVESMLSGKVNKVTPSFYQKTLPVEVNAKSPKTIEFYYEYNFSNLKFENQLSILNELSSSPLIIAYKVYSIDGWEDVETELTFDFKKLISSKEISSYSFNTTTIADFALRLSAKTELH